MAGGTNDHPCTPTFLQLYKILSAFSILKPPKLGNCTPSSSGAPKSIITISRLKELYKTKKVSAFEEIKKNLKVIVEDENSDFNDFINMTEHDYALPEILDSLLFYTTGSVSCNIQKRVECQNCLSAFLSTTNVAEDTSIFSFQQLPQSFEAFLNPKKEMLHPNILMYKLVIQIEILFRKYCHVGRNAFDFILKDLTSSKINIQFSCKDHVNNSVEIVAYVIQFYLQIRFRECPT